MKGAILIIGSLLWEDESNSINKKQGIIRKEWRKKLELENKIPIQVPIRYGRKSSSKRCTYTMIFSNSVESLGTAYIVPFKKESNCFGDIKLQALELSIAEGISTEKHPNRLIAKTWGAVGIVFNKHNGNIYESFKADWSKEFVNESFNNEGYRIDEKETPSILKNGELNFEIDIPKGIDYIFATPVMPNIKRYPDSNKIAEAINESKPRYDTYVVENYKNGIRAYGDREIIKGIGNKE